MLQWLAVMKYILWSLAVSLISDPVQKVEPPVEITATDLHLLAPGVAGIRHSTSRLQLPDLITAAEMVPKPR